jgi:uncharacterized Zn finger protein (UPF0148 family)
MNYFKELNKKLDKGWKLCSSSCDKCKKSLIFSSKKNILYCLNCNVEYDIEKEDDK